MSDVRHSALKKDIFLQNPFLKNNNQPIIKKKKPHVNVVILENIEK